MVPFSIDKNIFTRDGRNVTLYDCIFRGKPISLQGYGTSSYISTFLFIGAIFNKPEEIKFESISIYFSQLNEWVNKKSIEYDYDDNFDFLNVKYQKPKSCSAKYNEFEFNLKHGLSNSSYLQTNEIHIAPNTKFEIKSLGEGKLIREYLDYLRPIQDLLSLATNTAVYPQKIYGIPSVINLPNEVGHARTYPHIEIYFPVAWWPEKIEKRHSTHMLFKLNEIEDEFTKYIGNSHVKTRVRTLA